MKAKIGITVLAVIFVLANNSCEYTGTRIDDEILSRYTDGLQTEILSQQKTIMTSNLIREKGSLSGSRTNFYVFMQQKQRQNILS